MRRRNHICQCVKIADFLTKTKNPRRKNATIKKSQYIFFSLIKWCVAARRKKIWRATVCNSTKNYCNSHISASFVHFNRHSFTELSRLLRIRMNWAELVAPLNIFNFETNSCRFHPDPECDSVWQIENRDHLIFCESVQFYPHYACNFTIARLLFTNF